MKGIWIILKQVASLGCEGQEVGRSRGHQVMRCGAPVHGGALRTSLNGGNSYHPPSS